MTTYMGPGLGSLVPVRCLSSLQVQPSTRTAISDGGLSGRRIYVDPPSKPSLRTWQANINVSDPNEVGTLVELESLRQSLWLVSDAARVANVFTPAAALGHGWSSGSVGAPVALAGGGFAATSWQLPGAGSSPLVPVVPGMPVSASIHVRASAGQTASARLQWMTLGGAVLGTAQTRTTSSTASPLPLLTFSATPPANAHVARLNVSNTAQIARPALTWTAAPQPWRPGGGAESVHLSPLSEDLILAWSDGRALSSYSYTVTEVSR